VEGPAVSVICPTSGIYSELLTQDTRAFFSGQGRSAGCLFVVLPAAPNTNGGLIENLFLIRKPHTRSCLVLRNRKSGYARANLGHPVLRLGVMTKDRTKLSPLFPAATVFICLIATAFMA
jgi:hypothetical protein